MKILAKVKPNSKEEKLQRLSVNNFILHVKSPAKENRANMAAVELLSKYFDTPKSMITILRGKNCKDKIFNIENI
jgi:uncharacterized protein YggU (UPF0235/DUF167 family)